jgi:putative adenylate-forming enzyme
VTGSNGDRTASVVMIARFVRARWGHRFRSRARFEAWQARRARRFVRRHAVAAPFYRELAGAGPGGLERLEQLPIVDKTTLLDRFDGLNTRGIRLADALSAALEAEHSRDFSPLIDGDLTVGLSSGTSGRRAAFLVSPGERMRWAGTILARVLDSRSLRQLATPWAPPLRVAFFLRAGGKLYESVASWRIRFRFHDLLQPLEQHVDDLGAALAAGEGPHIVVAPPSVLVALAERATAGGVGIAPRQIVSVAEVLSETDKAFIEETWGVSVRQVYQATEGLLGVTCRHGSLHLNEESVVFEREWLDDARTRFVPVVTDVDRRTQIIARYRLDDVLRVHPDAPPCLCGRVTAVVEGVDGREDSVLRLPSADRRSSVDVFPDVVRRAMALGSDAYADWRIRQRGLDVHVALAAPADDGFARASAELCRLFEAYGCASVAVVEEPWVADAPGTKLRRIVREAAL